MVELSSSFELEVEALDRDHRKMIDQVNRIVGELEAGNGEICKLLVPDFATFCKQHFAREEALLQSVDYPHVDKHRRHHLELHDKLDHMIEFAKAAADNPMARDSLKKELVFFTMDDVITTDLNFKEFLATKA